MENYNFIVLGSESELYKFAYSDLQRMVNAHYVPGFFSRLSRFKQYLFRLHFSYFFNRVLKLPLKYKWARTLLGSAPVEKDNTVFVFFSNWVRYEQDVKLVNYIKNRNKRSKFVWFLQDLYSTQYNVTTQTQISLEWARNTFDLILSFDQGDCERYGFIYHPLVFSDYNENVNPLPISDVYFLGLAKNRLPEILETFKILRNAGLKCDFHIAGVNEEEREYKDEIDYSPNIKYLENLQHVYHTKCIVELMQRGGLGFTQRGVEAVGMGKMLLTNNRMISTAPFYSPNYVFTFDNPTNISNEVIDKIKLSERFVDYGYKEKLSPCELMRFIINHL